MLTSVMVSTAGIGWFAGLWAMWRARRRHLHAARRYEAAAGLRQASNVVQLPVRRPGQIPRGIVRGGK